MISVTSKRSADHGHTSESLFMSTYLNLSSRGTWSKSTAIAPSALLLFLIVNETYSAFTFCKSIEVKTKFVKDFYGKKSIIFTFISV